MSNILIVRDKKSVLLYWEEELWRKIDASVDLKGLSRVGTFEEAQALLRAQEEAAAKRLALFWLGKRALFSQELRSKLARRHFALDVIERILAAVCEMGAIQDQELAKSTIDRELKKGKSYLGACAKLRSKLHGCMDELPKCSVEEEKEALLVYCKRKKGKDKMKLLKMLLQRGFKRDLIEEVLKEIE